LREAKKGGEHGAVIKPGKPESSPLYVLPSLPEDDLDVMPAKGKLVSKKELAMIKNWIASGAPFPEEPEKRKNHNSSAAKVRPQPKAIRQTVWDQLGIAVAAPDKRIIHSLRQKGVIIRTISANGHLLEADLSHLDGIVGEREMVLLKKLNKQIVWLDLSGSKIAVKGWSTISHFKALRMLHLEKTGIDDQKLKQIKNLKALTYLNLTGTKVSDRGLSALGGLKNLQNLYLWKTRVTAQGAETLKKAIPGLMVVR